MRESTAKQRYIREYYFFGKVRTTTSSEPDWRSSPRNKASASSVIVSEAEVTGIFE
jgi:hypothetical protein